MLPLALVIAFAIFSLARTETFFSLTNVETMLRQMAPQAIAAFGLTVVLVMGDFDLSLGAMIGLGGTTAVVMMSEQGLSPVIAILVALLVAAAIGCANGIAIAYAGASSFVITLAAGTILQGLEYKLSDSRPVYQNIPTSYQDIATGAHLGLSNQVWFAAVIFVVLLVVLERSELGRRMYAIGGNQEAARLSGIRVRSIRLIGFVAVAACATTAGILMTSQAGQSSPDLGIPYLLPVFAAAFLGATTVRVGQFNMIGTLVGATFLQVLSTGLIMLELKPAAVNIAQGGILAVAVLVARLGKAGRG